MREGEWRQLDVIGWPDNQSCANLLAWSWSGGARGASNRFVVVVNLSGAPAQGRVGLPWADIGARSWQFTDLLQDRASIVDGAELQSEGLFVSLDPWQAHTLALR